MITKEQIDEILMKAFNMKDNFWLIEEFKE